MIFHVEHVPEARLQTSPPGNGSHSSVILSRSVVCSAVISMKWVD